MNTIHITNAIVEQHRAQLEGQARRHRQVRVAKTRPDGRRQRPHLGGALRWLSRTVRPTGVTHEPGRPATLVVVGDAPGRDRSPARQPIRRGELVGVATTDTPCPI
jgi:hypothetical protein